MAFRTSILDFIEKSILMLPELQEKPSFFFRHRYENSVLTEESLNARAVASAESLDDLIFRKSQYEKLHKAISKLPDLQRRRLALYYFGGYTFEQIGNMEGCTKRAVKKSVDAAVANLRNILEKNNL